MALPPEVLRRASQGMAGRQQENERNRIAQLLNESALRGRNLGNTQRAVELSRSMQPKPNVTGAVRQLPGGGYGQDISGPGGKFIETRGVPGYEGTPTQPKRSPAWQKAIDEGLQPGSPDFIKRIQQLNTPKGQTINVGDEDPLKGYTKSILSGMGDAASTAGQRISSAEEGLSILKSRMETGNETGKWAPMQTSAAAWLGINPDEVADAQLFDVKMGDRVMGRIQQTKGAVSEKEMAYFGKISPGSDKEPFTNYVLLEIDRRAAVREQDKIQYVRKYLDLNGDLLGFDEWYLKTKDPIPEFDLKQMKEEFNAWATPPEQQGGLSADEAEELRLLEEELSGQ